jgi:hypothetical protein
VLSNQADDQQQLTATITSFRSAPEKPSATSTVTRRRSGEVEIMFPLR